MISTIFFHLILHYITWTHSHREFICLMRNWFKERIIQISTIGTTLVDLLLLRWMRGMRNHRSSPAHLVFLSCASMSIPTSISWLSDLSEMTASCDRCAARITGQARGETWSPTTPSTNFWLCARSRRLVDWREGRTASKKKVPKPRSSI